MEFTSLSTTGNILTLQNRAGVAGHITGNGRLYVDVGGLIIDAGECSVCRTLNKALLSAVMVLVVSQSCCFVTCVQQVAWTRTR